MDCGIPKLTAPVDVETNDVFEPLLFLKHFFARTTCCHVEDPSLVLTLTFEYWCSIVDVSLPSSFAKRILYSSIGFDVPSLVLFHNKYS